MVGERGADAVYAELPDGRGCYLPLAWTDRQPRLPPRFVDAKPVRLDLEGLRLLVKWVAARALQGQKLDFADRDAEKGGDEPAERPAQ